jgi:hypothetical protein
VSGSVSEPTLSQLGRDEADRVEAEQDAPTDAPREPQEPAPGAPEPEPAPEPDGPQEPAQPPTEALTEAQIEARTKAWERERDRHFRELEKRDDQRYALSAVCPLCEGHGMIFPQLPEPENTARRTAVSMALGGDGEPDYLAAPDREKCDVCDGWGEVLTGSRRRENRTGTCTPCAGTGFRTKAGEVLPIFTPAPVPVSPQPFGLAPGNGGPTDAYGRPFGHLDFGKHPASVNA